MSSSPFLDPEGWTIRSWKPDPVALPPGIGIPDNAFQVGGLLQITHDATFDYRLTWQTGSDAQASVSGLRGDLTTLKGEDLKVHFGARAVACNLELNLDSKHPGILRGEIVAVRTGTILKDQPDTGAGTFTATANPDPNVTP